MPRRVYWLVAFGVLSFSLSPILVRFAGEAPPLTIAAWRTTLATFLLLPFFLRYSLDEARQLSRRDWTLILVAGVMLGVHFYTFFQSLFYTSVASAAVYVSMTPIFLSLIGYFILKEHLSALVIAGVVLSILGAILIATGDAGHIQETTPNPVLGNALALFSCVIISIYLSIGRVARKGISWLTYVFPLNAACALTDVTMAVASGTPLFGFTPTFYGLCLLMAIGPHLLGHGSFNYALRYIQAPVLGVLSLSEPIGASLLAYILFGEFPSGISLGGMILALLAVGLVLMPGLIRSRLGT